MWFLLPSIKFYEQHKSNSEASAYKDEIREAKENDMVNLGLVEILSEAINIHIQMSLEKSCSTMDNSIFYILEVYL